MKPYHSRLSRAFLKKMEEPHLINLQGADGGGDSTTDVGIDNRDFHGGFTLPGVRSTIWTLFPHMPIWHGRWHSVVYG
jgi:hypothetical protein